MVGNAALAAACAWHHGVAPEAIAGALSAAQVTKGRLQVKQWRGVLSSCGIVATGFAIFALSRFPPTQRFGLVIVFGTAIAAFAALFSLPLLGGARRGS